MGDFIHLRFYFQFFLSSLMVVKVLTFVFNLSILLEIYNNYLIFCYIIWTGLQMKKIVYCYFFQNSIGIVIFFKIVAIL